MCNLSLTMTSFIGHTGKQDDSRKISTQYELSVPIIETARHE